MGVRTPVPLGGVWGPPAALSAPQLCASLTSVPPTPRQAPPSPAPSARSTARPGTYGGLPAVLLRRGHAGHLGDDGGHVGGAVELDPGQAVLVGLHHTLDSCGGRRVSPARGAPHPGPPQALPSHSSSSGLKLMAKSWDTWVDAEALSAWLPIQEPPPLPGRGRFAAPGAPVGTEPHGGRDPGERAGSQPLSPYSHGVGVAYTNTSPLPPRSALRHWEIPDSSPFS